MSDSEYAKLDGYYGSACIVEIGEIAVINTTECGEYTDIIMKSGAVVTVKNTLSELEAILKKYVNS